MKALSILIIFAAMMPALLHAREAVKPLTDSQFARSFACPESLPSDDARKAAMARFVDWGAARHPNWEVSQLIAHRVSLLEAHGCVESLRSIGDAAAR